MHNTVKSKAIESVNCFHNIGHINPIAVVVVLVLVSILIV